MARRIPRTAGALSAFALTAGLLSGCGTPPWEVAASASATPTPTATETSSPTGSLQLITNDLQSGSAKRELSAGAIAVSVDYWSTLDMGDWTSGANKPVSFSLTADPGKRQRRQKVYLSKVTAQIEVTGDDGVSYSAPAAITDQSRVTPGYYVKKPYSYSGTFVIPSIDARATAITMTFTYELLMQTEPKAKTYSKQTATDSLQIAIVQPVTEDDSDS